MLRGTLKLTPNRIAVATTAAAVTIAIALRGGAMFSPGALSAHSSDAAPTGGVRSHAELGGNCSACHASPWSGLRMADRCLSCHAQVRAQIDETRPLHGRFADGLNCRGCHTEHRGEHGLLTHPNAFDHDCTGFPLTGKHLAISCKACHTLNSYKESPATCVGCHAEPKVHLGRFGTDCAGCHSTATWQVQTLFSPASGGSAFDHGRTAFPLTGRHAEIQCTKCHNNTKFKGVPTACSACHAEPKVHLGKFGTACQRCHSTTAWRGATFGELKHSFPVSHGQKKGAVNACSTCHKGDDAFRTYTCYGCHKHDPEKIAKKHRKFVHFDNCLECHADGRKKRKPRKTAQAIGGTAAGSPLCAGAVQNLSTFSRYLGTQASPISYVERRSAILDELVFRPQPRATPPARRPPPPEEDEHGAAAEGGGARFITSDYVLDETATLLKARRKTHLLADLFVRLDQSQVCRIEWTDTERFHDVREFFLKHADQGWSFTDCLSFRLMSQLRLRDALTKDSHFRRAGFTPLL